jgi:hypothetical protein
MTGKDTAAAIGIDLAVAAKHRVAVRDGPVAEDFTVAATLDGMAALTRRLRPHAPALVVGEPTAMSWLAVGC